LKRRAAEELLDQPGQDPGELAANLRDIWRLNRFFGGVSTVMRHLIPILEGIASDRPIHILDLATGSGDIPLAITRWSMAHGRPVRITASDASDEILAVAAREVASLPAIELARYDARATPLPDASVDIVLCSLALHHFQPADAVRVLQEMDRLSRRAFIVNDLVRSRRGYAGAWLAGRLTTTNRLTRHDAPLSVLRAYTPRELAGLLTQAGVRDAEISQHRWFRMAAVKVKRDEQI
jgi:ubiquinone/menaquinone biosynthesis C-methylase UbiE